MRTILGNGLYLEPDTDRGTIGGKLYECGGAPLYSPLGADVVRAAFLELPQQEARRAVRAVRRACHEDRPMRIRVLVSWERSAGNDCEDCVDAFGWRAALSAVRAMRAEWPQAYRLVTLVSDARLDDALWPDED